jgi:transcriptional regulator with XRE-family HTH domain
MLSVCRPSKLRLRRLARGLRLRDVSVAIGVHDTILSQVERGEAPLRGKLLHALAGFYQTDALALLAEYDRWRQRDALSGPSARLRAP